MFHGVERIVAGVLGTITPDLKDEMELLPGVLEVVLISKPCKLASLEFHPDSTTVTGSAHAPCKTRSRWSPRPGR